MKYIDKYLEYLKVVKKYSDMTITSYEEDLIEYLEFLGNSFVKIDSIDRDIVNNYLKFLYSLKLNKNSICRKLSSVRGLYNYLLENNIVSKNYFNDVSNPKKEIYLPKFLTEEELNKLFNSAKYDTPIEIRDSLIIELLYATGVRVSELVNIKIKDIDFNEKTIRVLGKGSKERIAIFNNHTKDALDLYLDKAYSYFNKVNSGYLILNKDGNRLSTRYVRKIIDRRVISSGINKKISPHTLRHTFATDLLEEGADLMTVKELLGHESLDTTSIYTHVTNSQIRKVYENAHPRAKEK